MGGGCLFLKWVDSVNFATEMKNDKEASRKTVRYSESFKMEVIQKMESEGMSANEAGRSRRDSISREYYAGSTRLQNALFQCDLAPVGPREALTSG